MGKNYYCEYCDKSFRDVLAVRKNHLKGALHQQMKKEHFDRFRDLKTLIQEESAREPCPRILKNLECNFGERCRFSHYMPWELNAIELRDQQAKDEVHERLRTKLKICLDRLEEKYGGTKELSQG